MSRWRRIIKVRNEKDTFLSQYMCMWVYMYVCVCAVRCVGTLYFLIHVCVCVCVVLCDKKLSVSLFAMQCLIWHIHLLISVAESMRMFMPHDKKWCVIHGSGAKWYLNDKLGTKITHTYQTIKHSWNCFWG